MNTFCLQSGDDIFPKNAEGQVIYGMYVTRSSHQQ